MNNWSLDIFQQICDAIPTIGLPAFIVVYVVILLFVWIQDSIPRIFRTVILTAITALALKFACFVA